VRLYLLLIGLIPVLALGVDFYLNHRSQAWEAGLGATARQIVADALGGSPQPLVSTPQQITESAPNIWTLDGNVTRESAGQSTNEAYRIEIEQICGEVEDLACWLPQLITVGGRSIKPRVAAGASSSSSEQAIETATLPLETTTSLPPEISLEGTPAEPASVTRIDDTAETTPPPPETLASLPENRTEDRPGNREATAGELAAEVSPGAGGKPSATATEVLSQSTTQQLQAARQRETSAQLAAVDMTVQESLIWLIQDRLNQLGYRDSDTVSPNGTLGPGTIFAIKAYQSNYGMPLDGQPSFELLDHLDRNLANRRDGGAEIDLAPQAQALAQAPGDSESAVETLEEATDAPTNLLVLQKLEQEVMPAAGGPEPNIELSPEFSRGPSTAPGREIARTEPRPSAIQQVAELPTTGPETLTAGQQVAPAVTAGRSIQGGQEADESLVFLIQDRLNRLGYNQPTPITLDGKLGPRTRTAIFDYQRQHGLESDGQPSRELLDHLEAQLTGHRARAASGQTQ